MSNWQGILLEPARVVLMQIGQFVVNILLVIVILIIGWVISKLIKTLVTKALQLVQLDKIADRIELDDLLVKGGIKYSLSELIGVICYWLALLVTFVVAVNAMGLTVAADLLNKIVLYIPNIIATIFILILGIFVSKLLSSIVQTAANNAGLAQGTVLSKVVEIVTIIFVIAIALEQLNIGSRIIELTISILLASLGLGLALSFGLGCKEIAGKAVAEFVEKLKKK
ncbi:MAG: hypothetical protein MUC39_06120 [Candidatus Omnitrophica bacterium]|jgi:hypothetical protein|nr:hypothetical protein [Candidatus Omnitrophota bacterium]